MQVKQVSWGRSKSANFQSQRADVVIELEEGDVFDDAMTRAKALVDIALGDAPSEEEVAAAEAVMAKAKLATQGKAVARAPRGRPAEVLPTPALLERKPESPRRMERTIDKSVSQEVSEKDFTF